MNKTMEQKQKKKILIITLFPSSTRDFYRYIACGLTTPEH